MPHTHTVTRDQKDIYDIRTYKADRKEIADPRIEFIAEPICMPREPEPLRDPPLIVPLEVSQAFIHRPVEPEPEIVVAH